MLAALRYVRQLTAASVLAFALPLATQATAGPLDAVDGCSLTEEVRAASCRLLDGQAVVGTLGPPAATATYRVDVLTAGATVELQLSARGGSTRVVLLDWHGAALGEAVRADDAPDVRVSVTVPLPGAYGVRVSGDLPPESPTFRLTATVKESGTDVRAVWPPALTVGDGPLAGERQVVRTPRGGTPSGGVAVARALGAPPEGEVANFRLVADVQFERIVGPSALTVRFRYEPEAGGGTGYLLSIDPFAGEATLDGFEEGRRRTIVGHVPLPFMLTAESPSRLVLTADGSRIAVTLDGLPVLGATDDRYPRGLVAVGAVTWSDPVAATFDHVSLTQLGE